MMMSDMAIPAAADPAVLAERLPAAEIDRLGALIRRVPVLTQLLDASPDYTMILNRTRQIVFANRALRRLHGGVRRDCTAGLRPGEALACVNSVETPGGCGVSACCLDCGALKAILASQGGRPAVEEWRMIRDCACEALDLRAFTSPLRYQGESYVVVAAVDISSEKRREALERCFMHDVANTVSGICLAAEQLGDGRPGEAQEAAATVLRGSRRLIDEVSAQRDLMAAEDGKLVARRAPFAARELLEEVAAFYRGQNWARGRQIRLAAGWPKAVLVSDRSLVRRVLGNMLKNALEACAPGDAVTLGFCLRGEDGEFSVHNPQVMPPEVKRQVFRRSFSTKGKGRGLGTYGMKLLTERYLLGRMRFDSAPGKGTTFRACLPRSPR